MGSCVFATRPKHQGIHDFNALNNNEIVLNNKIISCVVTVLTQCFLMQRKRELSLFVMMNMFLTVLLSFNRESHL